MRRIFWDTMLLIYLLEGHKTYSLKLRELLIQSLEREDVLCASWLAVGEVLAGVQNNEATVVHALEESIRNLSFEMLAFDHRCSAVFARLRAQKVSVADSIHLACAAATGMDLFLTNDKALHRLHVPGIKFIGGLDNGFI